VPAGSAAGTRRQHEMATSRINRAKLIEVLDHRSDDYTLTDEDHEEHIELMEEHMQNHPTGDKTAAVMIWLGILIDAIPESLVLGILANSGNVPSLVTFTCGVFVANFPEALSSSATMHACGIRKRTILLMWSVIWLGTGIGAALGAIAFPRTDEPEILRVFVVAAIEGCCGGAMLTMIANTVLPEAFEQSNDVVGLACTLGFMCAMVIKALGFELEHGASRGLNATIAAH